MDTKDIISKIQSIIKNNSKHLPFPLAITLNNIEYFCDKFTKTGFSSRFILLKSLIDFIEVYAKFISIIYLSECRIICATSPEEKIFLNIKNALIHSKLGKGKITYSLGDWLSLAEISAKSLSRASERMVFPELLNLVIENPTRKKPNRIAAFSTARDKIVSIRNRRLAHGYLNKEEEDDDGFDDDIELTLNCVINLLEIMNRHFEKYDLFIAFYLNNSNNNIYSWNIHGLEITELFSEAGSKECDKLLWLRKNDFYLPLSPFSYYTTGALSLEYYYIMDSIITKNKTEIDDIEYLGIGRLKSNHYQLKSFEQPQILLKLFSDFMGISQETTLSYQSFVDNLRLEIANRISRTIDRENVRRLLLYLMDKEKILFVEASPGSGKTILASWWSSHENCIVFFNRYGANSDPITQMYRYYYLQLSNNLGIITEDIHDPTRIKILFNTLQHKYILEKGSLILIFDGFDELPEEFYNDFFSFAHTLSDSAKLVIFTRPISKELITEKIHSTNLPPMTAKEIESIPEISELGLEEKTIKKIFDFSGGNPLISILAAQEAHKNKELFGKNLKDFYLGFYSNLISNHEKNLIYLLFATIIKSSRPLRFEELHELFSKYFEIPDPNQLSKAFKDISRFITVDVDGGCTLFHKSFADAINPEIPSEVIKKANHSLASFFENTQKTSDKYLVPHHLLHAGDMKIFLEKSKVMPKYFIDYFVSHAKPRQKLISPQFINDDLNVAFEEMTCNENAEIKLIVAQILYYFGFWQDAESLYEFVYNNNDFDKLDKLKLSITLGALYKNLDKWEKAKAILENTILSVTHSKTLKISPILLAKQSREDLKILCRLYNNFASILYDSGTSRKEAVKIFDLSRVIAEKCGDKICKSAADIGYLCYLIESASYEEAKKLINELMPIFKKYPVEELYLKLNHTAYCLRNNVSKEINEIFDFNIDDEDTMKAYLFGLQNRQITAYFFNNLAVYYHMTENLRASSSFIKICIEICREIEDYCMLSGSLINAGIILNDINKFEEAELIANRIGDEEELAACMHNRDAMTGKMDNKQWLEDFYEKINDPNGTSSIGKTRLWVMTQFIDLFL